MKFQEGDKIMVLATGERGSVVEWIDKIMLLIEVGGISFPVYADQIDFPYFQDFTAPKEFKKKSSLAKAEPPRKEKNVQRFIERDGVWLSFYPVLDKDVFDDDIISYYRLYVLNHTDDDLVFELSIYYGSKKEIDMRNSIRALDEMYLFDLPFENLNDQPRLDFDFSLVSLDKKRVGHFEVQFKPKPKQIFKLSEEVQKEQKASFNISLFETYPVKEPEQDRFDINRLSAAGFKVYPADKIKANLPARRTLIDLHADKLSDQHERLSPVQILDMQLKAFEKFYEEALSHNLQEITVIHGIGTGKLKDEIHELLRHKKDVKSFVNRLHHLYGYGATEIYILP
jgi:hypothetical protein